LEAITRFAERRNVHGVVCGQIHAPVVRPIAGMTYYNCGDWLESCSALVEHLRGRMESLAGLHTPSRVIPLPPMGSFEELD
jgi:UDP-2,3-diacylglucosamine pyrophosphatase LpxH